MTIRTTLWLTSRTIAAGLCSLILASPATAEKQLSGDLKIDGSSTVFTLTEAITEEFGGVHPNVRVPVGISGTGGGFKKFCTKEVDITQASRPIKPIESTACAQHGVEYIELPVAYDAITVVAHPKNTWASSLTVSELKKMWEPSAQGKITRWNQVRPDWPDQPLRLFGPGVDSGTFDYFTEAIVGKEDMSRGDYTSSEDDNIIVQGVANDIYALGFFGYSYYGENKNKLKVVSIDDGVASNGEGPQIPSDESVTAHRYEPLSRPLFIYVSKASLERPEVKQYTKFFLENASAMAEEIGYIPLASSTYELVRARLSNGITGSLFQSQTSNARMRLEDALKQQK